MKKFLHHMRWLRLIAAITVCGLWTIAGAPPLVNGMTVGLAIGFLIQVAIASWRQAALRRNGLDPNGNRLPEKQEKLADRDIIDDINDAVASITDENVEDKLSEVLHRAGYEMTQ